MREASVPRQRYARRSPLAKCAGYDERGYDRRQRNRISGKSARESDYDLSNVITSVGMPK